MIGWRWHHSYFFTMPGKIQTSTWMTFCLTGVTQTGWSTLVNFFQASRSNLHARLSVAIKLLHGHIRCC